MKIRTICSFIAPAFGVEEEAWLFVVALRHNIDYKYKFLWYLTYYVSHFKASS